MKIGDLTSALTGRRRRREGVRADAPRTIVPIPEETLSERAERLARRTPEASDAGPLASEDLDAARARLRARISAPEDDIE